MLGTVNRNQCYTFEVANHKNTYTRAAKSSRVRGLESFSLIYKHARSFGVLYKGVKLRLSFVSFGRSQSIGLSRCGSLKASARLGERRGTDYSLVRPSRPIRPIRPSRLSQLLTTLACARHSYTRPANFHNVHFRQLHRYWLDTFNKVYVLQLWFTFFDCDLT